MKKLIVVLAMAIVAEMSLVADTETVGGYTWTYRINGDTAEIVPRGEFGVYFSGGEKYAPAISPIPTGSVTIPSRLGGKPVVNIGADAFHGCDSLTSVTIGNGITNIGYAAFAESGLTHVTIPDSVVNIEPWAYGCCDDLTSVVLGKSVKNIQEFSFADCLNLKEITLQYGVTNIGESAFGGYKWGCDLRNVVVQDSVTSIGERAFWGSGKLRNVTLPIWCKTANIDWHDYLGLERKAKITYKDVKGGTSGGEVAEMWKKAQVVDGAVFRDGNAVGVVQVKVGKANKNGEVAVSGTITGLDGKKLTAKGGKVAVNGETATATLTVKDGTAATVTMGKDGVSGSWNGAEIKMTAVGGDWTRTDAKVYVDVEGASLPAGALVELLPDGEPVIAKSGKWAFNKGASVKLSKDKTRAEWDTSKGRTNLSSLKLTYTPKTGLFKGSFKMYALEGTKLKNYTINVTGAVVDGIGYGVASDNASVLSVNSLRAHRSFIVAM